MAFADLSSELVGILPGLSPFLAETHINRAWEKIRRARMWSFLVTNDSIICPTQITAGTMNVTQYSDQVTADATASAAIMALDQTVLPPQALQLRFSQPNQTSQIYRIIDFDDTVPTAVVFTLDRSVVEATDAASEYQCYRPYIEAPASDFLRWESITDMVYGIAIQGPKMNLTSTAFDRRDPQRQAFGQALYIGYLERSNNAQDGTAAPLYELWPGPTSGQAFSVTYRRKGVAFTSPTDAQPDIISDSLIIQAALAFYSYPFAQANVGHFQSYKSVNWSALISQTMKMYQTELIEAKRIDDEQALQTVYNRGHGLVNRGNALQPGVADAKYWQSHPITW